MKDDQIYAQNTNVAFHIHYNNGKSISEYFDNDSECDRAAKHIIMFPSGTEFLVCKNDGVSKDGVLNIYLREV